MRTARSLRGARPRSYLSPTAPRLPGQAWRPVYGWMSRYFTRCEIAGMARLARARRRLQIQDHGHQGPPVDSGAVYPMIACLAIVPNRAQITDSPEAQPAEAIKRWTAPWRRIVPACLSGRRSFPRHSPTATQRSRLELR